MTKCYYCGVRLATRRLWSVDDEDNLNFEAQICDYCNPLWACQHCGRLLKSSEGRYGDGLCKECHRKISR